MTKQDFGPVLDLLALSVSFNARRWKPPDKLLSTLALVPGALAPNASRERRGHVLT